MSEFEDTIADGVVAELDAGEVSPAPAGKTSVHAGAGTSSMHYGPGTSQTGGHVAPLNGGSGTTAGVPFMDPGAGADEAGADEAGADEATTQDRERALAVVIAQVKIDRAAADASFRAFCRGPRQESGHIAGLEQLKAKLERNDP